MAHGTTPANYSSSSDIDTTMLWTTGVLGTLVVAVIVLFSLAAFQAVMNIEHDKKVLSQPNVVDTLKAEQKAVIADTIGPAMETVAAGYAAEAPAKPVQLPAAGHADHDHHGLGH